LNTLPKLPENLMRRLVLALSSPACWVIVGSAVLAQSPSLSELLATLHKVEREGRGNRTAAQAWAELTASTEADQLPAILAAMDGAEPLAANWMRAAFDAIAERQLQSGGKLPAGALEKYLRETEHNPRARRLAYEWIVRADPLAADRLIPQMLDDPSLEMRRDAVARVIATAEAALAAKDNTAATASYRRALGAARDLDQVKLAAEALAKLGQPVVLSHHFGFVMDWKLVGPFSNIGGVGFDTAYTPEERVDVAATYAGSSGPVSWVAHRTDEEYGHVDLNKAIGKHMGAVAYATAEFQSDRRQTAELRAGSGNAVKMWLNGKLLGGAEAYHANDVMDQYVGRGELLPGLNVILVKICQNEQKEDWAQDWKFHLRVCDPLGKAILSTDRPAPKLADRPSPEKSAGE
jgi:hypothetical protein